MPSVLINGSWICTSIIFRSGYCSYLSTAAKFLNSFMLNKQREWHPGNFKHLWSHNKIYIQPVTIYYLYISGKCIMTALNESIHLNTWMFEELSHQRFHLVFVTWLFFFMVLTFITRIKENLVLELLFYCYVVLHSILYT